MSNSIVIYYFSGTGNTLLLVDEMRKVFEQHSFDVKLIPLTCSTIPVFDNDSMLGLAFPINSQSTLPFIWKFIKSLPKTSKTQAFMLGTFNNSSGMAKPLYYTLKRKGYIPVGCCEISMPNNTTVTDFNRTEDNKRLSSARKKIRDYAESIVNGTSKWLPINTGSGFVSLLTRNFSIPWIFMRIPYSFGADIQKCTNCGTCIKHCPVNNIKEEKNPVYLRHCEFCMRCISNCPKQAISAKRVKNLKARKAICTGFTGEVTE
ncbi:MAG: EFR1 family ferrodoxin [Clostridia bacterium]|nr:EFR1 family ferrodoxin [Clostridia bacterium]